MTYQIEIEESKTADFLQIVESLRRLGVVVSIREFGSFVLPGMPISDGDLTELVQGPEKQIALGESFSAFEIKEFMQAWRQR